MFKRMTKVKFPLIVTSVSLFLLLCLTNACANQSNDISGSDSIFNFHSETFFSDKKADESLEKKEEEPQNDLFTNALEKIDSTIDKIDILNLRELPVKAQESATSIIDAIDKTKFTSPAKKPVEKGENKEMPEAKSFKEIYKKNNKINSDSFVRKYKVEYMGIDVAEFFISNEVNEPSQDYNKNLFQIYSRTLNVADFFFNWQGYSKGYFRDYGEFVKPVSFHSKTFLRKKSKELELFFDEDNKIYKELVEPPDNRDKRKAVSERGKDKAYDTVSLFMQARVMIKAAILHHYFSEKGVYSFSLKDYNGRRLSRFNFRVEDRRSSEEGYYKVTLTREALEGYSDRELEEDKEGSFSVKAYLNPQDLWPNKIEGASTLGDITVTFVEDCQKSFFECIRSDSN